MEIEQLRAEIDAVNAEIADAVRDRMDVVEQIGAAKDADDRAVRDPEREQAVEDQFAELFDDRGLPPERGRELARCLIETAVEVQQ